MLCSWQRSDNLLHTVLRVIAIETLGGLSDTTADTIGRQRFGIFPKSHPVSYSKGLWRGKASAWIHRCLPPAPILDGVI